MVVRRKLIVNKSSSIILSARKTRQNPFEKVIKATEDVYSQIENEDTDLMRRRSNSLKSLVKTFSVKPTISIPSPL